MVNSVEQTALETSNLEEYSSSTISPQLLFLLKLIENFSLAAFIGALVLKTLVPETELILIWASIFLSVFIFLFLTNKKLNQKYQETQKQLEFVRKAELYLLNSGESFSTISLIKARENALRYTQELIDDYKQVREFSRNTYYIFQLATVVLSGITPILVLVDKLEANQSWLKWLPVICPAIASIVASIVTSFPFQKNWFNANKAVELLEAEQEKFILGVTPVYSSYSTTDDPQRQQKSLQAVENFIIQVNNIHLKLVENPGDRTQVKEEPQEEKKEEESSSSGQK